MGATKGVASGLGAIARESDRHHEPRHHRALAMTPKQAWVLELHNAGWSNERIARELGWKPKPNGGYNGAGIQVMLDVALNKSGKGE